MFFFFCRNTSKVYERVCTYAICTKIANFPRCNENPFVLGSQAGGQSQKVEQKRQGWERA
jgi:hypothetical protein